MANLKLTCFKRTTFHFDAWQEELMNPLQRRRRTVHLTCLWNYKYFFLHCIICMQEPMETMSAHEAKCWSWSLSFSIYIYIIWFVQVWEKPEAVAIFGKSVDPSAQDWCNHLQRARNISWCVYGFRRRCLCPWMWSLTLTTRTIDMLPQCLRTYIEQ